MQFPFWFQPRQDVPAVLVASAEEWADVQGMGWPDVQCPRPGSEPAVVADEPAPEPAKRGRPPKGSK